MGLLVKTGTSEEHIGSILDQCKWTQRNRRPTKTEKEKTGFRWFQRKIQASIAPTSADGSAIRKYSV